MPKWIHDRAKHLRDKNPDLPEGAEYGIATQQAYAAGKAPKGHGTSEGRKKAKKKYKKPRKEYDKEASAPHARIRSAAMEYIIKPDSIRSISGEIPS
jgi:hypothetical protein